MKRHLLGKCVALMLAGLLLLPLCASGETYGPEAPVPAFLQQFTAQDLDGNAVDESLFSGYKLTMINVWATYCPPCIGEMPDLGKLNAEYAEKGVQIVGIVSDVMNADGTLSESQMELARDIVQQTEANYTHLTPSEDLEKILLCQVYAVPATLFVNEAGELIGESYVGAADYDTWVQRIDETLELL